MGSALVATTGLAAGILLLGTATADSTTSQAFDRCDRQPPSGPKTDTEDHDGPLSQGESPYHLVAGFA